MVVGLGGQVRVLEEWESCYTGLVLVFFGGGHMFWEVGICACLVFFWWIPLLVPCL